MVVEVKAETCLQTEGHSRVCKVSFWRDSARLSRGVDSGGVVVGKVEREAVDLTGR